MRYVFHGLGFFCIFIGARFYSIIMDYDYPSKWLQWQFWVSLILFTTAAMLLEYIGKKFDKNNTKS